MAFERSYFCSEGPKFILEQLALVEIMERTAALQVEGIMQHFYRTLGLILISSIMFSDGSYGVGESRDQRTW